MSQWKRFFVAITPAEFIAIWKNTHLSEKAGAQSHFIDLCHLVGHPTPASVDAYGRDFTFERLVAMPEKRGKKAHGWADVYKKDFFAWEYKKPGVDLDKAYEQLKLYKDELRNPPLLVVSDLKTFRIHTNFNNAPRETYSFGIESLDQPVILEQLRNVFWKPEALRPEKTVERITKQTAGKLAEIAHLAIIRNKKHAEQNGLPTEGIAQSVARYLDRIVFCLFAEDIGLLGEGVFTEIVTRYSHSPRNFAAQTAELFQKMSDGGFFGITAIPHFNGSLFVNEPVIELSARELEAVKDAARLDWKDVDPSIFGTLFEHGLKTDERALLGAHYTGRSDIETLVEPVILSPLRHEWASIEAALEQIESEIDARERKVEEGRYEQAMWLEKWFSRLEGVRVLDPACGSGNFLSVTLGALLDLEKVAINWAADAGVRSLDGEPFGTRVRPEAMLGIEVNGYAQDLARTVVQITYLQWLHANGYAKPREPILRHTDNIWHHDALFNPESGEETVWPDAEFIVGNPPFLGDKKMRGELGDDYVRLLRRIFKGRVSGASDFCCYWIEKARAQVEGGQARRVGLVATQTIRAGKNREVIERVKESGDIFFGVSDRNWALKGANVHISLLGFDNGSETNRMLDDEVVLSINANFTPDSRTNLTQLNSLPDNRDICFLGIMKGGTFEVNDTIAVAMLQSPNPDNRPNSDVLRPRLNAQNIMQRTPSDWLIDFGLERELEDAAHYEIPFFMIEGSVKPERLKSNRKKLAQKWWLHGEARPGLRAKLEGLPRFLVTPETSKHRVFVWLTSEFLPDHQVRAFARSDDYFFGILQSKIHELWARGVGNQLREVESGFRYTPSTCFDTFPFPDATPQQEQAISDAAARLNQLRENWLNPPEWMKAETIEFRASENGPWHRHLVPDSVGAEGLWLARWTRQVPINPNRPVQDLRYDPRAQAFRLHAVTTKDALAHRTLTHLYNHPPVWLQTAHRSLDEAVFEAYAWSKDIDDEEVLSELLELNLERVDQTPRLTIRRQESNENNLDEEVSHAA